MIKSMKTVNPCGENISKQGKALRQRANFGGSWDRFDSCYPDKLKVSQSTMETKIVSLGEEETVPSGIEFDLFVYKYGYESYEGHGFAAWRKDGKYFYHEMGHCSCNGPWEDFNASKNVEVTLEQLKEIAEKSYGTDANEVVAYLEAHV